MFNGSNLSHELLLTRRQKTKLASAFENIMLRAGYGNKQGKGMLRSGYGKKDFQFKKSF